MVYFCPLAGIQVSIECLAEDLTHNERETSFIHCMHDYPGPFFPSKFCDTLLCRVSSCFPISLSTQGCLALVLYDK